MQIERANPAVIEAHSNQEYPISRLGRRCPSTPIFENIIYPCTKLTTTALLASLFIVFLAIPAFIVPSVQLSPDSSLESYHNNSSYLNTQWKITVLITNPSKYFRVKYIHLKATMYLINRPIARAQIPEFIQGRKKKTTIPIMLSSNIPKGIEDHWLLEILDQDLFHGNELAVDIDLDVGRKFRLGRWWIPMLDLSISCINIIFARSEYSNETMLIAESSSCDMGFFGYI